MMLTVFEDEDKIFDSIRAGASGYLLKDATTDAIVGAVLSLMKGGAPISPAVARKMLGFVRDGEAQPAPGGDKAAAFELTDRELEILQLVDDDEVETAIADRLHISPHTVRTHIKNIYKKLHVHSRASVVRVAFEHNLLR